MATTQTWNLLGESYRYYVPRVLRNDAGEPEVVRFSAAQRLEAYEGGRVGRGGGDATHQTAADIARWLLTQEAGLESQDGLFVETDWERRHAWQGMVLGLALQLRPEIAGLRGVAVEDVVLG